MKTKIGINEIVNEFDSLKSKIKANKELKKQKRAKNILLELLDLIENVDFREYAEILDAKTKIQKKHYIVSVIEILLKKANENNFDLCRKNEMIYLYNSEFWEQISVEDFKDFLGKVCLKMGVDKFDAKLHTFKDEIFKQFISDAGLNEISSNSNTTLINLENGTFEINPNKQYLRDFKQSDFITYQLPFNYDKTATASIFQKYLDTVLPEKELQQVLAEYLGYIFIKTSILKLEKVLLLYGTGANGTGANGKSVLFEIMSALLGKQNISNYSLQSLTDEKGYHRAMLSNKLLNYASEIGGKLEATIFKQLVSGEPVGARLPYGNPQIINDYAKFIFNTNELPKEVENTNAFFRRFIIIPFDVTIKEKDQDPNLSKKIIENELSGVFNWVLIGLQRLLINQKFTYSEIVKNQLKQFRKESDSVLMFLDDENYTKSNTKHKLLKEIYSEYRQYSYENGLRPVSRKNLTKRLENSGFEKERKSYGIIFFIEKKC